MPAKGIQFGTFLVPVCWAIANLTKELFHQSPPTIPAKGRSHRQLPRFDIATQLTHLDTAVLPTGVPLAGLPEVLPSSPPAPSS